MNVETDTHLFITKSSREMAFGGTTEESLETAQKSVLDDRSQETRVQHL